MTINLQTGGYQPPQFLPGARGADIQVEQKQIQQDTVIPTPEPPQATAADAVFDKRYEQLMRAAQSFFRDTFVVSDKTFAIFKDASGQYVTRYKSLRDGRVTYIPEQRLLQAFESSQRAQAAVLRIKA